MKSTANLFIPREHQDLGIDHLEANDEAILLAGCGLGKTSMCLDQISAKIRSGESKGFLIVAPLRVANLTWKNEAKKWRDFKWLRVANLRTPEGMKALREGSAHIYTINYESIPKLIREYLKGKRVKSWAFDSVIWDELTKAKNPKAKRIRMASLYLRKCKRHWGLTGTPTPNTLLDLFAQIRLIDGGKLFGRSFPDYRDRYFEPIDYQMRTWVPKEHARKSIYKKIRKLCLTLRSEDWLDIPEIVEEEIEVSLPAASSKTYETLKKEYLAMLESGDELEAVNAAVLVNKLLQLTSGAVYIPQDDGTKICQVVHDVKIQAVKKFLKDNDEPVLVAYFFRHERERLMKAIPGAVCWKSAKTEKQQNELLKRWGRGEIKCLIANPASIGHGIDSLQQGGRTILWMTLTWSRELYDQTIARLARIGQDKHTRVVRLMMPGTVDDAVAEALRAKEEEQSALLEAVALLQQMSEVRVKAKTDRSSVPRTPRSPRKSAQSRPFARRRRF